MRLPLLVLAAAAALTPAASSAAGERHCPTRPPAPQACYDLAPDGHAVCVYLDGNEVCIEPL